MTLIEKIEAEKYTLVTTREAEAFNKALDIAIAILRNQPIIKAKALRKKRTEEYFHYNTHEGFITDEIPYPIPVRQLSYRLPKDSEIVPITIIVEE